MDIQAYLSAKRKTIEGALDNSIPQESGPFAKHLRAMRYSLFAGGKRLRPILCLATGEAIAKSLATEDKLLSIACALECIHTYSLIHDDLPAMDDDDLRRGKPTNHSAFGEAEAILAGDGLLTWAFDLLSTPKSTALTSKQRLLILHTIARAAGPLGMVGGQSLDMARDNYKLCLQDLETIHKNKTGALISCSVQVGAIGANASLQQIEQLTIFGDQIGLAFQIVDDLLNTTSTTEELGKTAGSDVNNGKATYPTFWGLEKARTKAKDAITKAIAALDDFGKDAEPLRALGKYIYTRTK